MAYRFHGERKHVVKFADGGKEDGDGRFKPAHESPLFPNLQLMFKNRQQQSSEISEEVVKNSPKPSEEKINQKASSKTVVEEDIDLEADEFIKRKHHSLYLQKLMSMNATQV